MGLWKLADRQWTPQKLPAVPHERQIVACAIEADSAAMSSMDVDGHCGWWPRPELLRDTVRWPTAPVTAMDVRRTRLDVPLEAATFDRLGFVHLHREGASQVRQTRWIGHTKAAPMIVRRPGPEIVSATFGETLEICRWDAESGRMLSRRNLFNLPSPAKAYDLSSDGRWAAAESRAPGDARRVLYLVDLTTGEHSVHDFEVTALRFAPDSRAVVIGLPSGAVKVLSRRVDGEWSATGDATRVLLNDRPVRVLAFSPDGSWLAAACESTHTATASGIKVWQFGEPQTTARGSTVLEADLPQGGVSTLALSNQQLVVVEAEQQRRLHVYDIRGGQLVDALIHRPPAGQVDSAAISADGIRLCILQQNGVYLYARTGNQGELRPFQRLPRSAAGHPSHAWFATDDELLTWSVQPTHGATQWRIDAEAVLPVRTFVSRGEPLAVALTATRGDEDGGASSVPTALAVSRDGSIRGWSRDAEFETWDPLFPQASGVIQAACFSPDRARAFLAGASNGKLEMTIVDLPSRRSLRAPLYQFMADDARSPVAVSCALVDRHAVVGLSNGQIVAWPFANRGDRRPRLLADDAIVTTNGQEINLPLAATGAAGRERIAYAASWSDDSTAHRGFAVVDLTTGERECLEPIGEVTALAFSQSGGRLLTGTGASQGQWTVWDLNGVRGSRRTLIRWREPRDSRITRMEVSQWDDSLMMLSNEGIAWTFPVRWPAAPR